MRICHFRTIKTHPRAIFGTSLVATPRTLIATRQEDAILSRTHPTPCPYAVTQCPPRNIFSKFTRIAVTIMQVSVNRRRGQRRWSTMGCGEAKQRQSRVSSAIYDSRYTVDVSLDDLRWRGCRLAAMIDRRAALAHWPPRGQAQHPAGADRGTNQKSLVIR